MSSGLYRLEAFGLANPWTLWAIERGGLDEFCQYCRGAGVVVDSPCGGRDPAPSLPCPATECKGGRIPAERRGGARCLCCSGAALVVDERTRCHLPQGCSDCRRQCPVCWGRRLAPAPPVLGEDFGDEESRERALAMFPGLHVDDDPMHRRSRRVGQEWR
jgi:hypothetical protein